MKKILRYISAVIGFYLLFTVVMAIDVSLTVPGQIEMLPASIIFTLPIAFLFRWLSLTKMSKREKAIKIFDNLFVLFIIKGILSLFGYASTILYLEMPIYLAFFSVGTAFIAIGSLGIFILNKIPLEKRSSHENSNIY